MAGAVADLQLLVLPALNRAGAVAVVGVDVQDVLVRVAALALLNADLLCFRVVFDVFDGYLTSDRIKQYFINNVFTSKSNLVLREQKTVH